MDAVFCNIFCKVLDLILVAGANWWKQASPVGFLALNKISVETVKTKLLLDGKVLEKHSWV